jgi:hypothetical protein
MQASCDPNIWKPTILLLRRHIRCLDQQPIKKKRKAKISIGWVKRNAKSIMIKTNIIIVSEIKILNARKKFFVDCAPMLSN